MKLIQKILDFIKLLIEILVNLRVIIPIIVAGITYLTDCGKKIIPIRLPVWVLVLLISLMLIPVYKLIAYIIKNREPNTIQLFGLVWRSSLFSRRYPQAYCPINGCDCEVIVRSTDRIQEQNGNYRDHYYECPIHGTLQNVPDESSRTLQLKVSLVLKNKGLNTQDS